MLKLLAGAVLGGLLAGAEPAPLRSTTLAGELAKTLSSQQLDAIAAQDPDDPERFEAAVFDGNWKSHGASEKEYEQQLAAADPRYTRLLEVLLRQLHGG
jgi:hypothetical protein